MGRSPVDDCLRITVTKPLLYILAYLEYVKAITEMYIETLGIRLHMNRHYINNVVSLTSNPSRRRRPHPRHRYLPTSYSFVVAQPQVQQSNHHHLQS